VREIIRSTQFKRDVMRCEKRGKEYEVAGLDSTARRGNTLPANYKDHPLSGDWKHYRDCHIEPDWLLLYKIDGNDLYLVRTGTHADLF
jgi:mRNA interferase YafQ